MRLRRSASTPLLRGDLASEDKALVSEVEALASSRDARRSTSERMERISCSNNDILSTVTTEAVDGALEAADESVLSPEDEEDEREGEAEAEDVAGSADRLETGTSRFSWSFVLVSTLGGIASGNELKGSRKGRETQTQDNGEMTDAKSERQAPWKTEK
jgi:hypothetical protein